MTSYKTIVRGLVKTYIYDYIDRHYSGWAEGVRVDVLTISEDRCMFSGRAVVKSFTACQEFAITGEVLPSGHVVIACVEN